MTSFIRVWWAISEMKLTKDDIHIYCCILVYLTSSQFQVQSVLVRIEIECMLTLSAYCQNRLTPVRRHHYYSWTSFNFFQKYSRTVIPTQSTTAISYYDVTVVHDFEGSWLVVEFKLVIVAFKSNLVLVDRVVFSDWKKSITLRME